jgi:glycosyltransferase involved in cell wall biosynthesis
MIISLCIPTLSRAIMLVELLDSIFNQHVEHDLFEVVVSDDASHDNTLECLEAYKTKLPNLKILGHSKNIGFDRNFLAVAVEAKGEYLWFLGDDDRLEPDALTSVIQSIKDYPGIAGITLGSIDYDSQLKEKTGYKPLPPTGLLHSADEVFSNIGDLLGFMSTLVIHRDTWNAVCKEEPIHLYFKLYVQVYIIGKVLQRKPLWLIFNHLCIGYRSDNDQFIKKLGWYDRLKADVEAYHAISLDLFGENSKTMRNFESKIFKTHVKARLINGTTQGLVSGNVKKVIKLLYKHYCWLPAFWLYVLPVLLTPRFVMVSLRRFYQTCIPFSGAQRAKKINSSSK